MTTKAELEVARDAAEQNLHNLNEQIVEHEEKFNALVGKYAELARAMQMMQDRCGRAERQAVRFLEAQEQEAAMQASQKVPS